MQMPAVFNLCPFSFLLRSFFQDGLKTADKLKQYIEKLAADLYNVNASRVFVALSTFCWKGLKTWLATCLLCI